LGLESFKALAKILRSFNSGLQRNKLIRNEKEDSYTKIWNKFPELSKKFRKKHQKIFLSPKKCSNKNFRKFLEPLKKF